MTTLTPKEFERAKTKLIQELLSAVGQANEMTPDFFRQEVSMIQIRLRDSQRIVDQLEEHGKN